MIAEQDIRVLTAEEADLLTTVRPYQRMMRCAFAGVPFRLEDQPVGSSKNAPRYSEALILSMVEHGLLLVIQCAAEWPGRAPARPFTVILSPVGERERVRLLKHSRLTTGQDHRLDHAA
ncbi:MULTISPECIES: hypothetical protein [unclassified Brevundimonas]|uniref:hypothetical protein n=1 Tax=unclassified Brevundimonas TaxID=2622653 RepID=UPI0025C08975|nr:MULTISPECIES: hypothetical protein [unclassified Brevundimonas]